MKYKRKEVIGDCTLYLADCMDIMPELGRVDAVVTDPPYELSDSGPGNSHFGMSLNKFDSNQYKKIVNGVDYDSLFDVWSGICAPMNGFVFCSNKQISKLMIKPESMGLSTTLLIWHKINAAPFANGVWKGDIEYIVHFRGKGAVFIGGANEKNKVIPHPLVIDKSHPTVKPLKVIQRLIRNCSSNGQLILDPFMGSGTTGVACVKEGRSFIGIELDEDYFEIACKRIREAYDQPDIFVSAPQTPATQETLTL